VWAGAGRSFGPWSHRQFGLLIVAQIVCLALVCLGAYAAGGTGRPTAGLRWLALSALGLLLVGAANGMWLMLARRRLTWARVELLGGGAPTPRRHRPIRPPVGSLAETDLVTHSASTRFHRPGCDLVVGRASYSAPRARHEAEGRRPCEVCEP
jgi:hypothetical protein